ncbi:unnamed protein product [Malus baccata var. baccata]
MLDASAGEALVDKTHMAAKTLIANRALNAQQYEGVGQRDNPRQQQVNEENQAKDMHNYAKEVQNQAREVIELKRQMGQMAEFMGQFSRARFMQSKKDESEKDIFDTFRKVKRASNKEVVRVSENVSAVLQRKLPPKCKDPCSFTIPCVIRNTRFEFAMLDLGASINVMPYSIYASMILGELKNDGVIIQLADRSNAYPKGVLEYVLVQVNHLVFPADFYVLEMEDSNHSSQLPILLGRPFMKTAHTKIDVFKGTLTMEFDGEVIDFNISDAMRYPYDGHSCFSIDVIDSWAQEFLDNLNEDALEKTLTQSIGLKNEGLTLRHANGNNKEHLAVPIQEELVEMVATLESNPRHIGKSPNLISIPISITKLLPSVIQPPSLELKPLPSHLKYVFLGEQETLPVIISSSLIA